jgi:hypothetical protein
MYLLIFASVAMVIMSCDGTSANVSRKYDDMTEVSTSSGSVNLHGDAPLSAEQTGPPSTHIPVSSEYPGTHHEEALTDSSMYSSRRDGEREMCASDITVQSLSESLETKDGTNYSSSALVYVSAVEENEGKVDLDVGDEGEKSIFKAFEGLNSSVMSSETEKILSKAGVNFIKSLKPVYPRELLTMVEITTNYATEMSEENTSRISKETREFRYLNAESKNNRSSALPDVSAQISSKPTSVLFSKISSTPNGTVLMRQNNEYGHSLASRELPSRDIAASCNQTVLKGCNPETDLVALGPGILRLTDSTVKPAMLQRPSRTSAPILNFPDMPEGEELHIQELGLSEGIFVFSYISSFLSWIQPYDFPVGKPRVECACKGCGFIIRRSRFWALHRSCTNEVLITESCSVTSYSILIY